MLITKKSSVLIATFSPWMNGKRLPINGNLEPMLDFFIPKVKKTVLIDQVYPGSDFVIPRIEVYSGQKKRMIRASWWMNILSPFLRLANRGGTHIIFKLRDFLSVFDAAYFDNTVYDIFIGFEAINAIAGVFLKRLGKVRMVIYYVSDYSPKRYKQHWFNTLYLSLDRYAAKYADIIWDVSPAMQPARIKSGLDPLHSAPVIIVPNALYPAQIKNSLIKKNNPHSLVFMGTLGPENGPDLAIRSLPYVLKDFPDTTLHIVGGTVSDIDCLELLTSKLNIKKAVIFHGFIADRQKVSDLINNYALALAPYKNIPGSPRLYGDATKIRAYMAAGLPTITTQVPPLGKEVEKAGAAFIVKDDPREIASVIKKVFTNKKLFLRLQENALKFAKENTWDNEYTKAFNAMKAILRA